MLRDIEYLIQLQEIDVRIHEQELAKKQLPATVAELQKVVETARKVMETAQTQAKNAEQELLTLDEHMLKAQEGLDKSQERLNSIKTNREYDAVHAEIESQKGIIHNSEARKKKIGEEIDRLKAAAEAATVEFEQIKAENEPKIAELSASIASIDSVIAEIEKEREAVKPLIAKPIIRTYDLIRTRRNHGRVLSEVSLDRTCTVCFKVLEPHLVSDIKRATKLILCQNCGSIFVWTDKG
jgi:predicted  nucleic acid-binding Zn-ribbon protein